MKQVYLILAVCSMLMAMDMAMAQQISKDPKDVEAWFKTLPFKKEKLTKLHFYFHDTVSGKNPSAVEIARSNTTFQSKTDFGLTRMVADPLTTTPEPNSKIVGRAQGIYGSASVDEMGLLMTLNFVFNTAEYNGSTLSVLGHNPILHKYRELPIVGGSGVFRLARGIATAQTLTFNRTSRDAVVEYNVHVLHYH